MNNHHIERMKRYTDEHVRNPQPDDHFTDQFCSVAFIEERHGDIVMVAKPIREANVFGKAEPMLVADFIKWASYKSSPGYWLELWPPSFPKELLEGG